jgi:hypothetical protein
LSLPGFVLSYAFDDYNFLGSTQQFRLGILAPDPGSILYRPISRELYFGLLNLISPGSALGGHVINAVLLGATVLLGASLTSRLSGRRAGIIAGLMLAAFGHWSFLVAWVSGAQDLFAIVFALLALHLELRGKHVACMVAFGCALLSKETTVAVVPALVAAQWIRSSSPRSTLRAAARFAALVGAWALIHPGIHALAARGGAGPPGSYIGLDNPERWTSLLRYLPVLANLPLTGFPTSWPWELTWGLAAAAVPFLAALWLLREHWEETAEDRILRLDHRRWEAVGFGLLLGVPSLIITVILVQHWAPYYMCFPAVGFAVALSSWLATRPYPPVVIFLLLFLLLGTWSRGIELASGMPTERNLAPAGKALDRLEKNFKKVAPSLPPSSLVYVSTMATGAQSVYLHLHTFQILRIWYRDPTIQTLRPELRVSSGSPEVLFGVDPRLSVFQIDVRTLAVRSSDGPVEHRRYRSVLTSYAIGLAGIGETQRAVDILLGVSQPGSWDHVVDRRVAAMLLVSNGENEGAADLLRGVPDLPSRAALEVVGMLLTVPNRGTHIEVPALHAFGLSPEDPKVVRALLRGLLGLGYNEVSERLAKRLMVLAPGDLEATKALKIIRSAKRGANRWIVPPIRTIQFPAE